MRKKKQLDIATKGLREMIIKQNMRDFRKEQADKEARRSKEYGRVLYEVRRLMGTRSSEQNVTRSVRETEMIRSGDWSTAGQKRTWRDGGRTARGFTGEVKVGQEKLSVIILDFMPPRMRRWTQTVMRKRTKSWTFTNRKAKSFSGMIRE